MNDDIRALLLDDAFEDPTGRDMADPWDYQAAVFEDTPSFGPSAVLSVEEGTERNVLLEPDVLRDAQQCDAYRKQIMGTVGDLESPLDFDMENVLIRRSPLDGAAQRVVPSPLPQRVLYRH